MALVHFQVPTDPWYIFKWPRVVHFGWPPRDSTFSDRYATIASDPDYAHFGDFSVIGDVAPKKGGGQPYAIAVHYIYATGKTPATPLHVAHYVSQSGRGFKGDAAGKIREASALLTSNIPRMRRRNAINVTAATADFAFYASPNNTTNPERMKRLAIKHHLFLMTNLV